MIGSRAAIRYAKATLQQADEAKAGDLVIDDMRSVQATIRGSKELRTMLKSPVIKAEDKRQALVSIFSDQSQYTHSLINVLVANKRTDILAGVAESYISLYNEAKGIKEANVTTAVALSSELESQVLEKVKEITGSTNVTLKNDIDASIIGGFILRVGDLQYNASIANKLGNIKREFSKSL
jgi:F-type H+-transporting ATPase subunit delta